MTGKKRRMKGWQCDACSKIYIPVFQDYPEPDECNCGGQKFHRVIRYLSDPDRLVYRRRLP